MHLIEWGNPDKTGRRNLMSKRVILLFVLSLALTLVPFSYALQAQSDQNLNQDKMGSQSDQNRQDATQSQSDESESVTTETESKDAEALPRTAGELPLLALMGTLSLFVAAGLRLLPARQRR
jgi:hypothetical protein